MGDWDKQVIEITSWKKGRKESDFKKKENKENYSFFLSSASEWDIVTSVHSK